jgi:hypothetical protein
MIDGGHAAAPDFAVDLVGSYSFAGEIHKGFQ